MHLGHVLSFNLSDTADILQRSHWFIKQPNDTLIRFGFCSPHYNCMPLYGCALWSFNSCVLKQLDVSPNRCLHHIRSLSCYCHANVFIMCQVCLISVFSSFISCFSLLPLIVMSLYVQFFILLVFRVIILLVIRRLYVLVLLMLES